MKDPVTGQGDTKSYFNAYDLNGDGFIKSSELGLVMKVFAKANYTKREIKDMLAEVEMNYDGKVTLAGNYDQVKCPPRKKMQKALGSNLHFDLSYKAP